MQTLSNLLPVLKVLHFRASRPTEFCWMRGLDQDVSLRSQGLKMRPEGWNTAASVIALTLCDFDTPVWLSGTHAIVDRLAEISLRLPTCR